MRSNFVSTVKKFYLYFLVASLVVLPVVFLFVLPMSEKHVAFYQEVFLLRKAEKKSTLLDEAIARNAKEVDFLSAQLQQKSIFLFIEAALEKSHLSAISLKPEQEDGGDKIRVVTDGGYRDLLYFFVLLSQKPNAIIVTELSIEKNHIIMTFKNSKEDIFGVKSKTKMPFSTVEKALDAALIPIEIPRVLSGPIFDAKNIQSPFSPRVFPKRPGDPFLLLKEGSWCLSGEVRQKGKILGVFLRSKYPRQSRYFGIGLPWENGLWEIEGIDMQSICFRNTVNQHTWMLNYLR